MTRPLGQTKYSVQNMGNSSFDEDFGVNTVEIVGFDGTVLRRVSLDTSGNITTSDSTVLLRRLVQLLQPLATQDINNRLRVTIDSITNGIQGFGVSLLGLNSLVGPVTNYPTTGAPVQQPVTGSWQPVWIGPVDQRFQIIDAARLTYNQGIRSHLSFT
jgi:hypothetical protein